MSLSTWPETLPAPTLSFTGRVESAVVRTKMDSGRYRQRRRFTSQQRIMQVRWEMTDAQFQTFQTFHYSTLHNGADAFQIELPLGDGLQTYIVRLIEGAYTHEYRAHMNWLVGANIEITDQLPDDGEGTVDDGTSIDVDGVSIVLTGRVGYYGLSGTEDTDAEVAGSCIVLAGKTDTAPASVEVGGSGILVAALVDPAPASVEVGGACVVLIGLVTEP